jgi:peptidyl-dipeptidase Dcp
MRDLLTRTLVLLVAMVTIGSMLSNTTTNSSAMNMTAEDNPLLATWEGPYGGIPPFDRVQIPLFKPALEAGMNEQLAEIQKIANDPAPPDFENTIVALERSGRTLNRIGTVYGVWGSTMASPDYQAVQREMAPRLAGFQDQITQNEALFKRVETVYNSPAKAKLNAEQ